jgi:hypothetical protein
VRLCIRVGSPVAGASPVRRGSETDGIFDALCSNLSWNTTDETLREVSVVLGLLDCSPFFDSVLSDS